MPTNDNPSMTTRAVEKNLRILVVDDNRAVHEDFHKILLGGQDANPQMTMAEESLFSEVASAVKKPDFELESAYQGEEALAKVRQAAAAGRPFAMAFVDVRMPPGWDGVETTARIWREFPDLQVVICTAYSDYSWDGMLAKLGGNDQLVILKKPFDTMEVLQLANALTEKWRLSQESRLKLEELEKLVEKRTADLRSTNQDLQAEILVRKEAEARIREQARMLDLAHDAILVQDLEGLVLYWNLGAERLYGWKASEVVGSRAADRCCGDPAARDKELKARTLVSQGDWSGELNHVNKAGDALLVHSRWTLVRDERGRPNSILVISTDITEKKRLEAQFIHAQRMESIGTLAIGIAHDLNNILAPVMMIGPLLRMEIKDPTTLSLLDSMEEGARRGADIVRQILTFSRGARSQKTALQTFRLLKEFSSFIRETFPKTIQFNFTAPKDLWMVRGNSTELHQVLVNLCQNAREAMPEGGALTLSAGNVMLDESTAASIPNAKPGRHVVWTFADTGVGIPHKNLDRVFDPFFTTKEVGKGPGLGLSTVLGIVQGCGGFLQLKSEPGRGTEVKVWLPALEAETRATEKLPTEPPRGGGELLLVVDDEEVLGGVVQKILAASGYRVLLSTDEAEAEELYRRNWRDIGAVLVDLMMPQMEKTVASFREINPAVKLLASGDVPPDQLPAALRVPPEMFLSKPYQTAALLDTLRKALGG
jgi:PAS domain S-box-containing protein